MERFKRVVKILLGIPLTLISFFFIGKIFIDSWPQIQEQLSNANSTLLALGVIFMLGFFLVRSVIWEKILNLFAGVEKSLTESIYHYALAETKRYIPGNIFSFISRVQKFESKAHTKKTILQAIILESIIVIIASFLVSLPALFNFLNNNNYILISFFILLAVAGIGALIFLIFKNKISKFASNKITKLFPKASPFSYINIILSSSLSWLLFGIANFFLATAIYPIDPNNIIILSSIFILSWLVGYLAFVVPMGLGIREAATIYLLSPFAPLFAATAISVFTRIFFVFSEVIFLSFAYILKKLPNSFKIKYKFRPLYLVAIGAFAYTSYFTFFTIVRHLNFMSGRFDLGNMEQTVWNTINGNIFMISNYNSVGESLRLSIHADFILILIAPIYAVFQSAITLLVIQTLVIGLGGFFVYLIAKKVIKSPMISVLLAIGYYFNFFVQEQNIFDFHSVSLATTFILAAFYFLLESRYKLFSLFLLLAVITKENVFLVSSLFGGFLIAKGKRISGSALLISSVFIFLFLMVFAIPWARSDQHFALEFLAYLGESPIEIILSPILKPGAFFGHLFRIETLIYIYKVFVPVGFISFLSPFYLIFMLPDFLINVMADNPNLRSIQYHYGALIVPFVYISAIFGIKKLLTGKNKEMIKNLVFYYLLAFIIFSGYQFSPLPGTLNADVAPFIHNEDRTEIFEAIDKIPQDASVSATNNAAAHLSQRKEIYVIPVGIETSEYLVFYKDQLDYAREISSYDRRFTVFEEGEDFVILKRINSIGTTYTP